MCTYNHSTYISEAIESVLSQTYTNFELIILNDGSTDNTADIIHTFSDQRIRYFCNPHNIGYYPSWNKAALLVKGTFCCQLDSDDILPPNSLAIRYEMLRTHNADIVLGGVTQLYPSGEMKYIHQIDITSPHTILEFLRGNLPVDFQLNTITFMFRTQILHTVGLRNYDMFLTQADYAQCMEMLLNCPSCFVDENVLFYRRLPQSMSAVATQNKEDLRAKELVENEFIRRFTSKMDL